MNKNKKNSEQAGFLLIILIISIAIMALLAALYYKDSAGEKTSPAQVGKKAIEQTKDNNLLQLNRQIEIQNELNSIH